MFESLVDLLLRTRRLLPAQVEQAVQAADALGLSVASVLLGRGILHEGVLLEVLNTHLQIGIYDPSAPASPEALRLISQHEAERMLVLPLQRTANQLIVAMVDPLDRRIFEELVFLTGREIRPLLGLHSAVMEGIRSGYRQIATKVMQAIPIEHDGTAFAGELDTARLDTQPEQPTLKLLARRLEALLLVLEQKGLIGREEITAALHDLDLEDEER